MSQSCDLPRDAQQISLRATRESEPSKMQQIAFIGPPIRVNLDIPDFEYSKTEYNEIVDYYTVIESHNSIIISLLPIEYKYTTLVRHRWIFAKNKSILELIASYERHMNNYPLEIFEVQEEPKHYSYKLYFIYEPKSGKIIQFTSDYSKRTINNICSYKSNQLHVADYAINAIDSIIHKSFSRHDIVMFYMEDIVDFKIYQDISTLSLIVIVDQNITIRDGLVLIFEFTRQNKIALQIEL